MKKLLVIQEHNADKVGLHWDFRLEMDRSNVSEYLDKRPNPEVPTSNLMHNKVLASWVIKKCRLPLEGEKILAVETEDHPWDYKNFEGEIKEGYGKGTVKLIFSDYIEVLEESDTNIEFVYNLTRYKMFKVRFGWLMIRKE